MSNKIVKKIEEVQCPVGDGPLVESNGRFGCPTCNLWVRRQFRGYMFTPQDIYDMLHGDRVGPVPKDESGQLTSWTDFHDFISKEKKTPYKAAMAFKPKSNYEIITKFPDSAPRAPAEPTGKLCPVCQENGRSGLLVIRSNKSGEKFVACNAYPNCKYTEPYAPYLYKGAETKPVETPTEPVKPEPAKTEPEVKTEPPIPSAEPAVPAEVNGSVPVVDASSVPPETQAP